MCAACCCRCGARAARRGCARSGGRHATASHSFSSRRCALAVPEPLLRKDAEPSMIVRCACPAPFSPPCSAAPLPRPARAGLLARLLQDGRRHGAARRARGPLELGDVHCDERGEPVAARLWLARQDGDRLEPDGRRRHAGRAGAPADGAQALCLGRAAVDGRPVGDLGELGRHVPPLRRQDAREHAPVLRRQEGPALRRLLRRQPPDPDGGPRPRRAPLQHHRRGQAHHRRRALGLDHRRPLLAVARASPSLSPSSPPLPAPLARLSPPTRPSPPPPPLVPFVYPPFPLCMRRSRASL